MAFPDAVIDEMRANLKELAAWNERHGYWAPGEAADIGRALKADLDSGNTDNLASWRIWLHREVEFVRELNAMARGINDRIRGIQHEHQEAA